jgi:hypothetical protein
MDILGAVKSTGLRSFFLVSSYGRLNAILDSYCVKAVKGVKFTYESTPRTLELLSTFRALVNDAIRICLSENIRGRLKLRDRINMELRQRYGVVSCFPYSVAEVAWSIVKKHKLWDRRPSARKLMLKMDAASFSLNYSILSLPFKRGERVLVPLRYGDYQRSFLMDKTLKRGSVTMRVIDRHRVLQGGPDHGTIETDRLRPQREISRRQRRDEA